MSTLFYIFLLALGIVGAAFYVLLFVREVPGFAEQRFGRLEDLPPDLGKWRPEVESAEAKAAAADGLRREVRHWLDSESGKLLFQARYRNQETNEIVRADRDVVVKRKRIKP